ncbi:MAG TPA: saccharopine dehydrogenase, partial [Sandaracinaceae bacterium]
RSMAAATRVLATTVGPFEHHGELVLRACVKEGTDYLDITGEPLFVQRAIDRYDAEARERGLKIVSCCGFDSIPHDLGVLFTIDRLAPRGPVTIEGIVRSRGTISGGTWHSAIHAFSNAAEYARMRRQKRRAPEGGRRVRGLPPRVRYEREVGGWIAPLPTIDPEVVLRSARLLDEYGPDFAYGHYVCVKRLTTLAAGAAVVSGVVALAQIPPARALLLKVKDPGEGPSEEQRARAWFRVTFLAQSGDRRIVTEVSGGDPGYGETSKMLAESALCLALDRERTPALSGVITPAAAMGRPLIERLTRAGIAFRVVRG